MKVLFGSRLITFDVVDRRAGKRLTWRFGWMKRHRFHRHHHHLDDLDREQTPTPPSRRLPSASVSALRCRQFFLSKNGARHRSHSRAPLRDPNDSPSSKNFRDLKSCLREYHLHLIVAANFGEPISQVVSRQDFSDSLYRGCCAKQRPPQRLYNG